MSRCAYCRGFIWPWERRGHRMIGGVRSPHHFDCWLAEEEARAALAAIERYAA